MKWTSLTLLFGLLLSASSALAQAETGRIIGTVTDAQTAQPLSGVGVSIPNSRHGSLTGQNGQFIITGVAAGTHTVRAQLIGYGAQEASVTVSAGQAATVNLQLQPQAVALEGIVAIGYGTQRRRDITGSVASVNTEALERAPIAAIDQALQGTAPGVQVTTASSAPGGGISVRIRGGTSLSGANEPLYVVDGFPLENDESSSPGAGGRTDVAGSNPLSGLNPNDIESIEILKDASATAIYGARGANGVVLITTKRGAVGRPRVTFDTYAGTQEVARRYELLNGREFALYANEWATSQLSGDRSPIFSQAFIDSIGEGTDWQDQIYRTAPIQNYQVSVTGGTSGDNQTRYSLSGGYFDQEGVVVNSGFKRGSARLSLDQEVGSRLNLTGNVMFSQTRTAFVPTDGRLDSGAGSVGAALQYMPILPVRRADGAFTHMGSDAPSRLIPNNGIYNPVALTQVTDDLGETRILGTAAGTLELLDGLDLRVSLGLDNANRTRDTYYDRGTLRGQLAGGEALRGQADSRSYLNENTLTYQKTFGDIHDLTVLGGYTWQTATTTGVNMSNTGFISDATEYWNIGAGTRSGGPGLSSRYSKWTMASYLGRINYNLLGRYLVSFTGRYDGSSRFGADNRWGFFPSVAVGWRLSDEPFLRDVAFLDELKLRASYGASGNPSIRPYNSQARLADQGYSFGGQAVGGIYPYGLANPDLGWESTYQLDIGADVGLFRRATLTADYYHKRTDDLLLYSSLPGQSGFLSVLENLGAVENRGYELALGLRILEPVSAGAFGWNTDLNFSRNRNKVLDLGGLEYFYASSISADIRIPGSRIEVGKPIGVFYGFKTAGVYRDSADVLAYGVTRNVFNQLPAPGDPRIVDLNGDGRITTDDRTIIGDPNPNYSFGVTNTFTFRGFEFSSLLQGVRGAEVINLNLTRLEAGSPQINVSRDRWVNRWTPENRDAKHPRVGSTAVQVGTDFTDTMVEDGSYLRLRTLSLAYNLPTRWPGVLGFGGTRIYATGQNLFTWTNYSGFNPDVSSRGTGNVNRGVDAGAYPLARMITVGATVTY